MQEMLLYEYAIIRVVPRVEREEFVNVGAILYCKSKNYLHCSIHVSQDKIWSIDPSASVDEIEANLKVFELIVLGKNGQNKIAQLETAARFRWLTATRSTIIQCSKVHIGQNTSLDNALDKILNKCVL